MNTIEECLKVCDNQFDLVVMASKRARQLSNGARPAVKVGNDKSTVVALKEIAEGFTEFNGSEEEDII